MRARRGPIQLVVAPSLVALLVVPGNAVAEPRPTLQQVQAKLVKLNEQADTVVERYNQATEKYKTAKKKYDRLNGDLERKDASVEDLRQSLVSVAINKYQFGGMPEWQGITLEDNPEAVLGSVASIDQMVRSQAEALRAFEDATRELRDQRNDAKAVLAEAKAARDKVSEEKKKVDRLVKEQTKLLRSLGTYNAGNPNSTGIKYTGPASGDARIALEFAYKQIGKPYQYGATGPNSYDCSGLTQAAWRAAGVELPRTTYTQWSWGANRRVSLNALQPGDLLFSQGLGHMGMYAGNGKMVHAPQTGDVVKVVALDDYWRSRLLGAVRP
jgi:cell wall-associated NlpC family hydrolase